MPDGKILVFLIQSARRPNEIFRLALKDGDWTQVTDFNREVFQDGGDESDRDLRLPGRQR